MTDTEIEIKDIVKIAYNAIDEKKGLDITVLDISNISVMADYFIIAGGTNDNQVKAMADNIDEKLREHKIHAKQIEGYRNARWILLDYGDVVIHIFNQDDRLFYDLERIWRDGKEIKIEQIS